MIMNTLDRYIARQYLFNVLALLVVLFSFVVAVDVSLNIDKYLEAVSKIDPSAGGCVQGRAGGRWVCWTSGGPSCCNSSTIWSG